MAAGIVASLVHACRCVLVAGLAGSIPTCALNAATILAGFVAFVRVGGRLDLLGQRIESLEKAVSKNTDLAARLARTEERQAANIRLISLVQADLRDMKHGRGFVQNRGGEGVNGEYE